MDYMEEAVCAEDVWMIGLKELNKFNMAMLAKQSWRLLTEANLLVSAIMKTRYYPQAKLIDAELGNNHSYVWRGIFASLEIIKLELVEELAMEKALWCGVIRGYQTYQMVI